jgi:hypothetical protein
VSSNDPHITQTGRAIPARHSPIWQELGSLLAVSIKSEVDAEFRRAVLLGDEATETVITILRHKVRMQIEGDPKAVEDDLVWLRTIEAYAVRLRKAIAESELLDEQSSSELDEARFEAEFCERFLANRAASESSRPDT